MLTAGARSRGMSCSGLTRWTGQARGVAAERGFTLIEVTIALFLFIALAFIMGSYYPKASLSGGLGRNLTYATHLTQSRMEEIKSTTFSFVTPANFSGSQTFTQYGITFTRTVTVTQCLTSTLPPCPSPINTTTSPNLTIVAVSLSWTEPSTSVAKTTTLSTVIHGFF